VNLGNVSSERGRAPGRDDPCVLDTACGCDARARLCWSALQGSARLPPAILNEVLMRRIGLVILALSLVLALRAVEAQQALRELDDALADIRC
jgi:hypothetical protein